jgi:hypothetical protein
MIPCRPIALLAAVLVFGIASTPEANAQRAVVEGVARAEDSGAPVPFALVRLVPADSNVSPSGTTPQGITSPHGRYRFVGVAAGRYRVQLLRIGFRPELSDPVQVAAGETAELTLRVASQPLELPPVTVRADECVRSSDLARHPRLLALWQQARNGASIREELLGRYRFHRLLREVGYELRADGPTPPVTLDQPIISDPRSALRNQARYRERWLKNGGYGPNDGWYVVHELDVLHEDFLRSHCLDASAQTGDGEIGLRFRPLRVRRDFLDAGGTIWLDSATYLARRIDLEYVDGEEERGTVRLDFADVEVAGALLRMPSGGAYTMRPSRKNPARRTEGKLTYMYSGFEEVRPR